MSGLEAGFQRSWEVFGRAFAGCWAYVSPGGDMALLERVAAHWDSFCAHACAGRCAGRHESGAFAKAAEKPRNRADAKGRGCADGGAVSRGVCRRGAEFPLFVVRFAARGRDSGGGRVPTGICALRRGDERKRVFIPHGRGSGGAKGD